MEMSEEARALRDIEASIRNMFACCGGCYQDLDNILKDLELLKNFIRRETP